MTLVETLSEILLLTMKINSMEYDLILRFRRLQIIVRLITGLLKLDSGGLKNPEIILQDSLPTASTMNGFH